MQILPIMFKNGLTRQITMKEEKKAFSYRNKNKKVIYMVMDETSDKAIVKFATTKPKTYVYKVQEDDYVIEDSKFITAKRIRKTTSKELTFHDFDKCRHYIAPIAKKQISFRI